MSNIRGGYLRGILRKQLERFLRLTISNVGDYREKISLSKLLDCMGRWLRKSWLAIHQRDIKRERR
jgi:hypothetical protein